METEDYSPADPSQWYDEGWTNEDLYGDWFGSRMDQWNPDTGIPSGDPDLYRPYPGDQQPDYQPRGNGAEGWWNSQVDEEGNILQPDWFKKAQEKQMPGSLTNMGGLRRPEDFENGNGGRNVFDALANNQRDARNRALQDQGEAKGGAYRVQDLMNSDAYQKLAGGPYNEQWRAQALGTLRDQHTAALAAASATLAQQYAAMGRALDPRVLALLQMESARQGNAAARDLLVSSAKDQYAGLTDYAQLLQQTQSNSSQLLANILGNTEYDTGAGELAAYLRLAGQAYGGN